jgi:hypothetical protein
MQYVFKGRLCGMLCPECQEFLSDVTVRLYRTRKDQNVAALAAAASKDTFAMLDDKTTKAKASSLIAEVQTDDMGVFAFELGEQQNYEGEPFDVDVYCGTVPHLPPRPKPPPPVQFSITTLQPAWRSTEAGFVAAWEYCIPYRPWCGIRGRFGAWTICGHVTVCKTGAPLPGMRALAFDADWTQDDPLGSAITDGSGHFRIDYTADAFAKTPFSPLINIEWVGGPDVYFRVETGVGTPLLVEPRSRGRQPDRENAGPCLCVELCVEEAPPTVDEPHPVFLRIGTYDYQTQIDSAPLGSGLTVGDHRAFFQTLRLNGLLSKKLNGNALEYMFEVSALDATGAPLGWTQIAQSQMAETVIGILEWYDPFDLSNPTYPTKSKYYAVNPSSAAYLPVAFSGDGWIRVPQESDYMGAGSFWPFGDMLQLRSETIATPAWGSVDLAGLVAGNSSTSTGKPLVPDRHFAIRMWVREAGNPATAALAGTCHNVAIDDTLYDNISHHPDWAGWVESGALAVKMVDIQELLPAGCSKITSSLTVLFTAAHPNLGSVTVYMDGPGGPYNFTLPGAGTPDQFGTATPSGWTVGSLPACAYVVFIEVEVLLTDGDHVPIPVWDHVAFCKE